RLPHRLFQQRQPLDKLVTHGRLWRPSRVPHEPRRVSATSEPTVAATRPWTVFISSSVRVRSSAWNVNRQATLRWPSGKRKTSNTTTSRNRGPASAGGGGPTYTAV